MAAVTMRDVARHAGVSEATVSYVLNGHLSRVSEETRSRVMKAVKELDYTPNTIARSLAVQTTWTIGLVVYDVVRSPFSLAIKGVESVAMRFGYNVILCNINGDIEQLERVTSLLAEKRVDGIICVLSSRHDEPLLMDRLVRRHIPVVLVNRSYQSPAIPSVLIDNTSGTYNLTRQLLEMGHRSIACVHMPVQGPRATQASCERLQGYQEALASYRININPILVREGVQGEDLGERMGYVRAKELLALPERPTAIVCCNDYLAIGAMRACEDAGLHIPTDMAIVGHDNISASRYVRPPLTTVDQPMTEAGEQATQLLVKLIWERSKAGSRGITHETKPGIDVTEMDAQGVVVRLPCSVVMRGSSVLPTLTR